VIVSSHILSEIQAVASRAMILHHGRMVLDEAVAEAEQLPGVIDISLRSGPDTATLVELAGVHEAIATGPGRWRITAEPGRDIRGALAETAVHEGWHLLEMRSHRPDLEARFRELTSDAPAQPAQPA
jgi:ABC-2 type transport system ATP-binding protein